MRPEIIPHRSMKQKKLRITEKDFLLANRRASRAEEIERHQKQITFRTLTQKSKKIYDRKRLKKAGYQNDDLPLLYIIHNRVHSSRRVNSVVHKIEEARIY